MIAGAEEDKKMPLLDHLVELRRRLLYSVLALFIAFFFCFYFAQHIFNHRHNATQLFFRGDAAFNHGRSRPRGLTANVEQVSAIVEHFESVGHGMVAGQKFPAVRKRVRRNVQDAHDQRAGAKLQRARTQSP